MIVNPNGLVPVHLRVNHGNNYAGQLCGFPPEEAAALVARGAAEYYEPPGAVVEAVEPTPTAVVTAAVEAVEPERREVTLVEMPPEPVPTVVVPVIGGTVDGSWLTTPKAEQPARGRRGGRK